MEVALKEFWRGKDGVQLEIVLTEHFTKHRLDLPLVWSDLEGIILAILGGNSLDPMYELSVTRYISIFNC